MNKVAGASEALPIAFSAKFPWGTAQISRAMHETYGLLPIGELGNKAELADSRFKPIDIRLVADSDIGYVAKYAGTVDTQMTEETGQPRWALDFIYPGDTSSVDSGEEQGLLITHNGIAAIYDKLGKSLLQMVYKDATARIMREYGRENRGSIIGFGLGSLLGSALFDVDPKLMAASAAACAGATVWARSRKLKNELGQLAQSLPELQAASKECTEAIASDLHEWLCQGELLHDDYFLCDAINN